VFRLINLETLTALPYSLEALRVWPYLFRNPKSPALLL